MKHTNFLSQMKVMAIAAFALFGITSIHAQDPGGKIVGGYNVNIQDHPYQVRLNMGCGGAIINRNWIITAEHCTEGMRPSNIVVRAGITRLNQSGGQSIRVKRVVILSRFNGGDISLMELERPLDLSGPNAKAIPYSAGTPPFGSDILVSGWGRTENQNFSNNLKAVVKKLTRYGYGGDNSFLRAEAPGKDSCNGDSGGPLVIGSKGNYTLLGIVSHGSPRCLSPGYYGNVAKFANRIQQVTGTAPGTGGGNPNPNPPTPDCTEIDFRIKFDNYPEDISWNIKNASGQIVASGKEYDQRGREISVKECLPSGCYTIEMNDSYGDGLCCQYGQGYYRVIVNGRTLAEDASFGSRSRKEFCLNSNRIGSTRSVGDLEFAIWPIPAESILNVQMDEEITSLKVVTLKGETVATQEGQNFINIENLASGAYILVVNGIKSEMFLKK